MRRQGPLRRPGPARVAVLEVGRKDACTRLREILREELPILPIYQPAAIEGAKDRDRGRVMARYGRQA